MAEKMLKDGEVISVFYSFCSQRGRMIEVETDQGWNPDRFFEEYPEEN